MSIFAVHVFNRLFAVVCSVTWPLDGSEARVDLVFKLAQTRCIYMKKSVMSESKQGLLHPRCHPKVRSLSGQP